MHRIRTSPISDYTSYNPVRPTRSARRESVLGEPHSGGSAHGSTSHLRVETTEKQHARSLARPLARPPTSPWGRDPHLHIFGFRALRFFALFFASASASRMLVSRSRIVSCSSSRKPTVISSNLSASSTACCSSGPHPDHIWSSSPSPSPSPSSVCSAGSGSRLVDGVDTLAALVDEGAVSTPVDTERDTTSASTSTGPPCSRVSGWESLTRKSSSS